MAGRRDEITMSEEEIAAYLADRKTMVCATIGPNGRPHLMPLWFVPDGLELSGWTFTKSQKAKNLERDPRATIQVEDGVEYQELRGVMFECDVEIERDPEKVKKYGFGLVDRYVEDEEYRPGMKDFFAAQAPKRVGLRFKPTRIVSWDHRKLGGAY